MAFEGNECHEMSHTMSAAVRVRYEVFRGLSFFFFLVGRGSFWCTFFAFWTRLKIVGHTIPQKRLACSIGRACP